MRSRCLYLLIAALVLLLGSTSACALVNRDALFFKTALRACASGVEAAPGQNGDVTASRVKEKCFTAAKCTLGHCGVHNEVLTETSATNHVTTHQYDAIGQRTGTQLPGSLGARAWTFDALGNVLTQRDSNEIGRAHV